MSTQFSSIQTLDRTLSGTATPDQSGPGNDSNKGVLHIPQRSSITGTSPSDILVSYPGHLFIIISVCWGTVGVFYSPIR